MDLEFGVIKHDAIQEDPEGAPAADEDGLPPPVVVFLAQHDVGCDDGDLHDRQDAHQTDDAQEAENVIISALVLPEAAEDEEEFDEDDGEGDKAGD